MKDVEVGVTVGVEEGNTALHDLGQEILPVGPGVGADLLADPELAGDLDD